MFEKERSETLLKMFSFIEVFQKLLAEQLLSEHYWKIIVGK